MKHTPDTDDVRRMIRLALYAERERIADAIDKERDASLARTRQLDVEGARKAATTHWDRSDTLETISRALRKATP